MELSGTSNHILLASLFHQHSDRWPTLATCLITELSLQVAAFVVHALEHVVQDSEVREKLKSQIDEGLEEHCGHAIEKLNELWESNRAQPITYDHSYTDAIGTSRMQATKDAIQGAKEDAKVKARKYHNGTTISVDTANTILTELESSLTAYVNPDMTSQACEDALARLEAYYDVSGLPPNPSKKRLLT